MSPDQSRRRLTLVVAAAALAIAAAASPAMASQSARVCPTAAVSHPFAPWGDVADYQLAPHGDVEDVAASWSLTGGARAVDGNETFSVTRPSDHTSMRMPAASTATTGTMCIAARHSSFRFFAKRQGGTASSRLLVEVVIDAGSGHERVLTAGQGLGLRRMGAVDLAADRRQHARSGGRLRRRLLPLQAAGHRRLVGRRPVRRSDPHALRGGAGGGRRGRAEQQRPLFRARPSQNSAKSEAYPQPARRRPVSCPPWPRTRRSSSGSSL